MKRAATGGLGKAGGAGVKVMTRNLRQVANRPPARWGDESDAFQDGAGAEPAAAAHGDERALAAGARELVHRLGEQDRAGAAERVTEGDGAAVRVDPRHVGPGGALPAEHDGPERLVDLDQVD